MKKIILALIMIITGVSLTLGNKLTVKVTSSASINGDKPVADARVVINNGFSQYSAYTNTSGESVFSDIQNGTYSVSITHPRHFSYSSNSFVNVYDYTVTTRSQMLLSNEIWGWIVDEVTGEPIADANVKVTNGAVQKTFKTGSNGYFYLHGFPEEGRVTTVEFDHRDYLKESNSAGSFEDLARLYRPSYGSDVNDDVILTPKVVEFSVVDEEITVLEIDAELCRYYSVLIDHENVDSEIQINHENKYKFLFTMKNTGNVPINAGGKVTITFMANGSQQSEIQITEKIDPGVELQIETEQLGFDFAGAIFPSIWIDFIAEYYDDRPVKGEKHSNSYLSIPVTSPYLSSKYILTDKAFYLPGEPVTLTCLVTNAAEEAGEVKYGITIRDLNKTQDDPDALVGNFVGSKQLAGNDSEYVMHQWTVPEDADSGTYMVLLMTSTTVQEGIEESVEEVNVLTSVSLNYFRVSKAPPDVQNTVLQFRYPECNYEVAAVTVSGNLYYVANYYIREEQSYININGYQYIPIYWKPFYAIVMDPSGEIMGRKDAETSEAAFTSSYYSELSFVRSALEGLSEQVIVMKTKIDRLSAAITEIVNSQLTDKHKRKLIWDAISLGVNLVEIGVTAGVKSIDLIDVVKDVIKIGAASTAFVKDVDSFLTGEYLQSSIGFPLNGRDVDYSSRPEEGFFLPDSYLSLIRNANSEYEESSVIITGVIILGCVVIDLIASRFSADLDKEISVLQSIKDMLLWRLNNGSQVLNLNAQRLWLEDIIEFVESSPDYSKLTKALGWTLDDPMGLSDGKSDDRLSKIFINLIQAAYEYESTYKYWKHIANTEVPQNFSNAIEEIRSVYDQLLSRQINTTYRVEDELKMGELITQAIRDGIFMAGGYSLIFLDNIDFIFSSNGNLELEVQVLKDGTLLTGNNVEVWLTITEIAYESRLSYNYSTNSFTISRAISSIPLSAREANYNIIVEVRDGGKLCVSGGLMIKVMDTSQYLIITDLIDTTEEERFLFDMLKGFGVVKKLCARDFRSSVESNVEEVIGLFPVAIVHWTDSSFGYNLGSSSFLSSLKAYIGSGGQVFLSGTAVKLLDLMGITEDRIGIRTSYYSQTNYLDVSIKDIDHPVTDKYTVNQRIALRSGGTIQEAVLLEKLEDGIKYLGESYSNSGFPGERYSMFETGYGDGRIFALGKARYNEYATLNEPSLRTLVWDIVDYLSAAPVMSSEIQESGQVGKELVYTSSFEVRGDEEVYGVTVKLVPKFPDKTEVISVKMIDRYGNESFPIVSNTYSFGNLLPGDGYTIEWTMKFNRLGYNLVTTEVYYREEPTERLKKIFRSSLIDIVAIPEIETDIYILGHFLEDIDECEMLRDWLGQVGHRVEIGRGLPLEFTPEIYPVTVVHFMGGSIGELDFGDLIVKLKDYIGSGGRLFLSGTAVKLLDLMGITEDRIGIRYNIYDEHVYNPKIIIKDIDHPVTDKYTMNQYIDLRSGGTIQEAILVENLEDGIKYLGQSLSFRGITGYRYAMFETGYGDGRIFALGNARYNEYATLNEPSLRTLVWDIVDYLSCSEFMIPAMPLNFSLTSVSTDTAAFSWEIDESDLRGFEIWREKDGEAPSLLNNTLPAESRSFVDTGLVPGTSYHYSLYAVNLYGKSKPAEVTLKTLTIPVLQINLSDYELSEFAFPIFIVNGSGVRTIRIVISPETDWTIGDAIVSSGFTTFVKEIVDGKLTLEVFSGSLLTDEATEICVVYAGPSGGAVFEPYPDLSSSRLFDIEGKPIDHHIQIDYHNVLRLVGDFNDDGAVDVQDLALFVVQYGKEEGDPGFDNKYDIGPRTGFAVSPFYLVGELTIEDPRKIGIFDLAVLAAIYNKKLSDGVLEGVESSNISISEFLSIVGR